jgi:hypothetical protein
MLTSCSVEAHLEHSIPFRFSRRQGVAFFTLEKTTMDGAAIITDALRAPNRLFSVKINAHNSSPEVVSAVIEAVGLYTRCREVFMQKITVTDAIAAAIGRLLRNRSIRNVTMLGSADQATCSKALLTIARATAESPGLQRLSLGGLRVSDPDVAEATLHFGRSRTVQRIFLRETECIGLCKLAIVNLVQIHPTLDMITVEGPLGPVIPRREAHALIRSRKSIRSWIKRRELILWRCAVI